MSMIGEPAEANCTHCGALFADTVPRKVLRTTVEILVLLIGFTESLILLTIWPAVLALALWCLFRLFLAPLLLVPKSHGFMTRRRRDPDR